VFICTHKLVDPGTWLPELFEPQHGHNAIVNGHFGGSTVFGAANFLWSETEKGENCRPKQVFVCDQYKFQGKGGHQVPNKAKTRKKDGNLSLPTLGKHRQGKVIR